MSCYTPDKTTNKEPKLILNLVSSYNFFNQSKGGNNYKSYTKCTDTKSTEEDTITSHFSVSIDSQKLDLQLDFLPTTAFLINIQDNSSN